MSKGILALKPLLEPREGVKAVISKDGKIIHKDIIEVLRPEIYNGRVYCSAGLGWLLVSELSQIVVEYEEQLDIKEITNKFYPSKITLPVHSDQWEYALNHIGKEVEIELDRQIPHQMAKLIISSNISVGMNSMTEVTTGSSMRQTHGRDCNIESWRDISIKYTKSEHYSKEYPDAFFIQWLKLNYHPPIKK